MANRRIAASAPAIVAVALAWLAAASPALALPQFGVEAFTTSSGHSLPPISSTGQSTSASFSFSEPNFPANMRSEDAFAVAGPGQLGVSVHAITHYPNAIPSLGPSLQLHGAAAEAFFVLDDLIVVLESDPSFVGSVQGSYSLELSGFLSANAVAIGGGGNNTAFSNVSFNSFTNLGGPQLGGTLGRFSSSSAPDGIGSSGENGSGVLAGGFAGHEVFTSAVQTLPVGTPFGMTVRLGASVNIEPRRSGEAAPSEFRSVEAAGAFRDTLTFPVNADVFNLPPGYTVHSVSGSIADNRFVPEPGTGALVLLGLGLTSFFGRVGAAIDSVGAGRVSP